MLMWKKLSQLRGRTQRQVITRCQPGCPRDRPVRAKDTATTLAWSRCKPLPYRQWRQPQLSLQSQANDFLVFVPIINRRAIPRKNATSMSRNFVGPLINTPGIKVLLLNPVNPVNPERVIHPNVRPNSLLHELIEETLSLGGRLGQLIPPLESPEGQPDPVGKPTEMTTKIMLPQAISI